MSKKRKEIISSDLRTLQTMQGIVCKFQDQMWVGIDRKIGKETRHTPKECSKELPHTVFQASKETLRVLH